ncbi:hypothetical protein ACOYR1_11320 [Thalassotalea piscium]
MIKERLTALALIITFSFTCHAKDSEFSLLHLFNTSKDIIELQSIYIDEAELTKTQSRLKAKKRDATSNKSDIEVNIQIVNNTNSQAEIYFIAKDSGDEFVEEITGESVTLSLEKKDYWVVVRYENIELDSIGDYSLNLKQQPGLETFSFNALTQNEQTIELSTSFFSKIIGISSVFDIFGNPISNSEVYIGSQIRIVFENSIDINVVTPNYIKNLIVGRTEPELDLFFMNWIVFKNSSNELNSFTFSYQSAMEDIDNFYVEADLSKIKPIAIDFSLPFLNEQVETVIGLQTNNFIFPIPSQNKRVNYYAISNSNKNYHAVNLLADDGKPLTQTPTFKYDEDGSVFLVKHAEIDGESEFVKSYLDKKQINVRANSTFWEQSVSYVLDKGKQIYVLGFAKPYQGIGNYSDSIGSSYKLGLNGSYEVRCEEQVITSGSEFVIDDGVYQNYTGDDFTSIEVPDNDCVLLTLEFKYDSYLNSNKYTSTSSYEFDQKFNANQANGGIIVTDLKLYEQDKLVTNSVISKANPRLVLGSQYTLFSKLEIFAQLEEGDWIPLPEISRLVKNSSVTYALPQSTLSKVLNLKIIAGDDFETITHVLNGFAQMGVDLDIENDADGDGIENAEDNDDDNDGIEDSLDNAPYDVWNWEIQTGENNNGDNSIDNDEVINSNVAPNSNGGSISVSLFMLLLIFFSRLLSAYKKAYEYKYYS